MIWFFKKTNPSKVVDSEGGLLPWEETVFWKIRSKIKYIFFYLFPLTNGGSISLPQQKTNKQGIDALEAIYKHWAAPSTPTSYNAQDSMVWWAEAAHITCVFFVFVSFCFVLALHVICTLFTWPLHFNSFSYSVASDCFKLMIHNAKRYWYFFIMVKDGYFFLHESEI